MPALPADKKTDFSDLITGQKPDAFLKKPVFTRKQKVLF
jgi:hypothetical protein